MTKDKTIENLKEQLKFAKERLKDVIKKGDKPVNEWHKKFKWATDGQTDILKNHVLYYQKQINELDASKKGSQLSLF